MSEMRESAHAKIGVEVKICGLSNIDDALWALEAGADYLGFIIVESSPRGVRPLWLARARHRFEGARVVAVFVNRAGGEVATLARDADLYAVQAHGDAEKAEDFNGLPCNLWRAVRRQGQGWTPAPEKWSDAERLVADSAIPGVYGGAGVLTDWVAAAELAKRRALMLAGGLTPSNVAAGIQAVRPAGVDVSSGVEQEPGRKDRRKVRAFVEAARRAVGAIHD